MASSAQEPTPVLLLPGGSPPGLHPRRPSMDGEGSDPQYIFEVPPPPTFSMKSPLGGDSAPDVSSWSTTASTAPPLSSLETLQSDSGDQIEDGSEYIGLGIFQELESPEVIETVKSRGPSCDMSAEFSLGEKVWAHHEDRGSELQLATIVNLQIPDGSSEVEYTLKWDEGMTTDTLKSVDALAPFIAKSYDFDGEVSEGTPEAQLGEFTYPCGSYAENGAFMCPQEYSNLDSQYMDYAGAMQWSVASANAWQTQASMWPNTMNGGMPGMDEKRYMADQMEAYAKQCEERLRQWRAQAQQLRHGCDAGQAMPMMPMMPPMPWMPQMPFGGPMVGNGMNTRAPGSGAGAGHPQQAKLPKRASNLPVACEVQDKDKTTVMLRNLPNDYTRQDLLELLDRHGFKSKYDFVYLPTDFKHFAGFGYAFVNMVSHEDAEEVRARLDKFSEWKVPSLKQLDVKWGHPLQGRQAHIDRYRNSPVMHDNVKDEHKPLLFENGKVVKFPPPTRKIRQPRIKRRSTHDPCSGVMGEEGDLSDD